MKIRWWMIGAVMLAAGGVLLFRHLKGTEEKACLFADNPSGQNSAGASSENEQDFEPIDFLA